MFLLLSTCSLSLFFPFFFHFPLDEPPFFSTELISRGPRVTPIFVPPLPSFTPTPSQSHTLSTEILSTRGPLSHNPLLVPHVVGSENAQESNGTLAPMMLFRTHYKLSWSHSFSVSHDLLYFLRFRMRWTPILSPPTRLIALCVVRARSCPTLSAL